MPNDEVPNYPREAGKRRARSGEQNEAGHPTFDIEQPTLNVQQQRPKTEDQRPKRKGAEALRRKRREDGRITGGKMMRKTEGRRPKTGDHGAWGARPLMTQMSADRAEEDRIIEDRMMGRRKHGAGSRDRNAEARRRRESGGRASLRIVRCAGTIHI